LSGRLNYNEGPQTAEGYLTSRRTPEQRNVELSVRGVAVNNRVHASIQRVSSSADDAGKANIAFRLLVDAVQDYAIFILDPEGRVLTWNSGARAIKGYTREEIVGKHFSVFYPQEAIESPWPERELALAEKEGRFPDEGLRVRKDGSTFWASVTITALREADGSLYGFAKVTQDLTTRREADERLQTFNRELRTRVRQLDESRRVVELRTMELQKLTGTLLQIQDEERRRIARELHDDLAQDVTAVKMDIDASGRHKQLSDAMGAILQKIRETSYLLHPPLLDEAGLRAALHWYVDGLMQRSKLQISLTFHPDVLPGVPKEVEMTIFRIIQEALTNVYRHAASDSAHVEVIGNGEQVVVRVRDFGKGISPRIARMESRTTRRRHHRDARTHPSTGRRIVCHPRRTRNPGRSQDSLDGR
jgi:PAS domain S-box-containing protein